MGRRKPFEKMTASQLAEAMAEYEKPWTGRGLPGKRLSAAQKELHRKARLRAATRKVEGA